MKTVKNLIRWIKENETLTLNLVSLFFLLLSSVIPFGKVSIVLLFLGIPVISYFPLGIAGMIIIGLLDRLTDEVR